MVFIQFIGDSEHHYITDTDFNIVPEILQKRFIGGNFGPQF